MFHHIIFLQHVSHHVQIRSIWADCHVRRWRRCLWPNHWRLFNWGVKTDVFRYQSWIIWWDVRTISRNNLCVFNKTLGFYFFLGHIVRKLNIKKLTASTYPRFAGPWSPTFILVQQQQEVQHGENHSCQKTDARNNRSLRHNNVTYWIQRELSDVDRARW